MDLRYVLHGEQEFLFYGEPIRAGDHLTVSVWIEPVTEKQGRRGGTMRFGRVITDFVDEAGAVRARARSTTIETEPPQ